ncbi:MAG TPA: HAMP domain-containing sensor histidine kinase [Pyrinomonadaceae bacterium]|jgi:signal transduction histidine kinase|nr:HAMP domain-containing sensor histidine kinase [Pyrinomonadaceae bacterium]
MRLSGRRRKSTTFFITLGSCLVALAVALNVGWILLNWREVAMLVLGIIFFSVIIAGLVLNTTFLVREIRRNEQHDAFINAVTHELKTPIASIRLYLETLQTREVDEKKRREFYSVMLADSDRLLHTVEQVLRAGQIGGGGGGRFKRKSEPVIDLALIVRDSLELARTRHPQLPEGAFSYAEKFRNGDRPLVRGDSDELRAVISNLLDNAVKYSPDEVRISVQLMTIDARRLAVRVRDQGIGIQQAQLKRIFRRFYRVPGRFMARFKGTGLGLFIVQSLVKKHGGRVYAESEGHGRGSTFTVLLPRAEGE